MHDLYIAYDKFSCQYILTTFSVIFRLLSSTPGVTTSWVFRSHSTPHAQFSLRHLPISFRFGLSHLLFSPQTHAMGFSSRFLPHTPSFLSSTCLLASSLGFLAYFSLSTPTTWFFRSYPSPHAQFSLRSPSISFRGGFSRLFFSSCTHDVGFPLANTRAHQFNKMYLTMRSNSYIICLEFRSS